MNQKGFSALLILLFLFILVTVSGLSFFLGRITLKPTTISDPLLKSDVVETSTLPSNPFPSRSPVQLLGNPLKRLYSNSEKLIGQINYPQEMLSVSDENLRYLQCSPEYYADYENSRYTYYEDPRAPSEEMKDEILYNLAQKLYEDYSVLADSFQACKVDDGRIILEYEKYAGGGGVGTRAGFVVLNADGRLEKITEIPSDGSPYFGCNLHLQLTKSNILWYRCGGGNGGFGSASVYKIDLNNKTHERVIKCTSQSSLDISGREPEIKCE